MFFFKAQNLDSHSWRAILSLKHTCGLHKSHVKNGTVLCHKYGGYVCQNIGDLGAVCLPPETGQPPAVVRDNEKKRFMIKSNQILLQLRSLELLVHFVVQLQLKGLLECKISINNSFYKVLIQLVQVVLLLWRGNVGIKEIKC